MNPKVTLEFRAISDQACVGAKIDPETRYKGGSAPERSHDRRLCKRKWGRRRRRRTPAATCVEDARLLSAGEETALAERIKKGDADAEQILIMANLGLVKNAVNDYTRRGVLEDDLIQEGNLGLIRAVRQFDPSTHTTRFATYATYWIRCFMVRALARDGPSGQSLGDLALAEDSAPDHEFVKNEDRAIVCAAVRRLSPFEAWVICERFGLSEPPGRRVRLASRRNDPTHETETHANPGGATGLALVDHGRAGDSYSERSYNDMAVECGLSVFRLRQVEKTALDKLRGGLAERAPEGT